MLLQRACNRFRDCAHAAACEPPGTDTAIDIAHHAVQEDICRTGRLHAERGTDDAGAGHCRFYQVVLEVVLEKLGCTHREEAHVLVNFLLAQGPELFRKVQEFGDVPQAERGRIRRRSHQGFAY